ERRQGVDLAAGRASDHVHVVLVVERAHGVARAEARPAPHTDADLAGVVDADRDAVDAERLVVAVAADAHVDVAEQGQPKPFALAADALDGYGKRDPLAE